ncbi:MAG: acyl-CoA synthetase FdrA [Chloroflexi bacterium]|nr:acyl-CoA synthetase FdrA [Chloroflexota bacterium]
MPVKALVKRNSYYDSVTLLLVASAMSEVPDIATASAVMATALNLEQLRTGGLLAANGLGDVGPNDLVLAVHAGTEAAADAALARALARLEGPERGGSTPGAGAAPRRPHSLAAAVAAQPETNLVVISVPGPFAWIEAEEAIRAGLHVLLFSDNVPIAEEVRLKSLARERGVLLMGPDCGTAILNGIGLGFANVVRRGPIGAVGASGTGLQQVTCLVDALGSGISQAIGTGGRDLRAEVGGLTMLTAIEALGADPETRVLALVSKPPAPEVQQRVLEAASATGKPTVAIFLGGDASRDVPRGVRIAPTLEDAARCAVEMAGGADGAAPLPGASDAAVAEARDKLRPGQRFVRGPFSGGTLCEEALLLLSAGLGDVYSNLPVHPALVLPDPTRSRGHTLVDLGADEFTVGRPHPMIDPTLRDERLLEEAADPETACLLFDVVLGYGAHPDPASTLAPVLHEVRQRTASAGRFVPVILSLCGTDADPQGLARQAAALADAGALVFRANAAAARAALAIVGGR